MQMLLKLEIYLETYLLEANRNRKFLFVIKGK